MFYECLWRKMAPYALEDILMEASQAEWVAVGPFHRHVSKCYMTSSLCVCAVQGLQY